MATHVVSSLAHIDSIERHHVLFTYWIIPYSVCLQCFGVQRSQVELDKFLVMAEDQKTKTIHTYIL